MMTAREKLDKLTLIDLLDDITKKYRFDAWENTDKIAEYLMANGVTVQKHGRWIKPTKINGRNFSVPHCSACEGIPCGADENTHYCPNCGAKMEANT